MKNIWIWLVAAVIVIGGGYWYWQSQQMPAMSDDGTPAAADVVDDANANTTQSGTPSDTTANAGVTVGATTGAAMSATVNYNGDAFSPSTVTIAKGGTVTFVSTAKDMWVASNPHPQHTAYDGTTRSAHCAAGYSGPTPFDQCAVGGSYSFTFDKTGSWGFHNHMNPGLGGTVIVQ